MNNKGTLHNYVTLGGGWVESDRYTCVRPSVTMRYRVGGWVKKTADFGVT